MELQWVSRVGERACGDGDRAGWHFGCCGGEQLISPESGETDTEQAGQNGGVQLPWGINAELWPQQDDEKGAW